MDTLDKGKHCSEEYCHQLDYLPMTCKACSKVFCADHFKYEAHNCELAKTLDYKIPVCEVCEEAIEFKRDKDLDLCLAEHMENCQLYDKSKRIKAKKYCHFKSCRTKEGFRFECERCQVTFCVKHRMPEVHMCSSLARSCSSQMQKAQAKITASRKNPIQGY